MSTIQTLETADNGADSRVKINSNFSALNTDKIENQQILRVLKTVNQAVNNSTVFVNDNHLKFNVGANETWAFDMLIVFTSQNSAPDVRLKYSFSGPVGSTYLGHSDWYADATGNNAPYSEIVKQAWSPTVFRTETIKGVIINGGTAGELVFTWAQNTAHASNTIVRAGSYIIAHKLT